MLLDLCTSRLVHMLPNLCTRSHTSANAPHLCTCYTTCAYAPTLVHMLPDLCTCAQAYAHTPTLVHMPPNLCTCSHTRANHHTLLHMLPDLRTCSRTSASARSLRSWGEMKVNQHRSTRMSATVGTSSTPSCTLTRPGRMRICSHAYRTIQRYV